MATKNLISRWRNSAENDRASERIFNICKDGGVLNIDHSPFGRLDSDLIDFRGYSANRILVKGVILRDIDLSYADLSSSWMETSRFENCLFVKTDFTDAADHENYFDKCMFLKCRFKLAALGYKGSRYRNCNFKECGFQRTSFIRPEFVKTNFIDCRLKGIDFNASSFENCRFEGRLEDVWFRGTFPSEYQIERFGQPKINTMENVSFENADLIDLTVSDGCDLSTVKLKNDGKYFKFDQWLKRLQHLAKETENWRDEYQRREAFRFLKISMVHAQKQDWKILNLDDIERSYGGIDIAQKIIHTLSCYSQAPVFQ